MNQAVVQSDVRSKTGRARQDVARGADRQEALVSSAGMDAEKRSTSAGRPFRAVYLIHKMTMSKSLVSGQECPREQCGMDAAFASTAES